MEGATPKVHRHGTHRTRSPRETIEAVAPFRRAMGITRLADVTGLDCLGIPVVQCVRPNARSVSVSQGKGLDTDSAAASALMESIEAHHAEHVELPLVLASYAELVERVRVVDVTRLSRPPHGRFDEQHALLWVEAHDLVRGEPCLVPYECVHLDYRLPLPTGSGCFTMSSNGLASGNHPAEAITHGLCELIERDARTRAIGSTDGAGRRRLRLETVDDPVLRWLLDRFAAADVELGVWDITSDVGVPVYDVVGVDRSTSSLITSYPTAGSGCHPDRGVALARALTESAQTRLTRIAGSRDDVLGASYLAAASPTVRRSQLEHLLPEAGEISVAYGAFGGEATESVQGDVRLLVDALVRVGIEEVLVVDLTKPALGIPVVRVVVPGLEAGIIHGAFTERSARVDGGPRDA